MDELVHDLTNALECSGCGQETGNACAFTFPGAGGGGGRKPHRKRRGRNNKKQDTGDDDDSEESMAMAQIGIAAEDLAAKLQLQNLSDNNSDHGGSGCCLQVVSGHHHCASRDGDRDLEDPNLPGNLVESDSVNENFSPVRPHRRRRKFKRMAIDPSSPSATIDTGVISIKHPQGGSSSSSNKVCKAQRHSRGDAVAECLPAHPHGKRKRNLRERSVDVAETDAVASTSSPSSATFLMSCDHPLDEQAAADNHLYAGDVIMESSSSSLASSEDSDIGVYTNDEGREGDDEQSDFYHEAGPTCGVPNIPCWWESESGRLGLVDELAEPDAAFRAILSGGLRYLSYESQQQIGARVAKLSNLPGREIRAGRRRLRDRRPGFSIKTSVNEKISKFLQDPEQNELRLHPMKRKEIDQLGHLASLYSLNMTDEGTTTTTTTKRCPVLTKTSNTMQAVKMVENPDVSTAKVRGPSTVSDIKRLRRTPPSSPVEGNLTQDRPEPVP